MQATKITILHVEKTSGGTWQTYGTYDFYSKRHLRNTLRSLRRVYNRYRFAVAGGVGCANSSKGARV